jgi:hypothetical protein
MRRLLAAPLLATAALTVACGLTDPEPDGSAYSLTAVDGAPLPATLPDSPGVEIVAGGFELQRRGDVVEWVKLRCTAPQPAGASCAVAGDGVTRRRAIYNALEARLYVGDGVYFPIRIDAREATIRFGTRFERQFRYVRAPRT